MPRLAPRSLTAALLSLAAIGVGALEHPADAAAAARARPADAFVESVGVNVHLGYDSRSRYRDYDRVQRRLEQLGVRYIRDGIAPGQPFAYDMMRRLAASGIRTNVIAGDPMRRWGSGPLASQLALIRRELAASGALASIEGPNEYDQQGDPNWPATLRSYQRRLHGLAKSDPLLSRFAVIGPSFANLGSHARLGDISRFADYGNIHPYPSGDEPDRDSHMRREMAAPRAATGAKPLQATETGYHNGVNSASTHNPASERAAGVYLPRLYLDYFRRGIARAFSYELIDQHPDPARTNNEANFGLLRNDFSPKPSFTALERTIGLLGDMGPSFETARYAYSVGGARRGLRRLLLQKRDGSFYLALWKAEPVWDPRTRKPIRASCDSVRVRLPTVARRVEVHRPSEEAGPSVVRTGVGSIDVGVSPSVTILKIEPTSKPTAGQAQRGRRAHRRRLSPSSRLRGAERRLARRIEHRSRARCGSDATLRSKRIRRWLVGRSRAIRRHARRGGWRVASRGLRYRAIRAVLRRT